jgi:hypothetical protein
LVRGRDPGFWETAPLSPKAIRVFKIGGIADLKTEGVRIARTPSNFQAKTRKTPDPLAAAEAVATFVEGNGIQALNVAGPRASGWEAGYRFALDVVSGVIKNRVRSL